MANEWGDCWRVPVAGQKGRHRRLSILMSLSSLALIYWSQYPCYKELCTDFGCLAAQKGSSRRLSKIHARRRMFDWQCSIRSPLAIARTSTMTRSCICTPHRRSSKPYKNCKGRNQPLMNGRLGHNVLSDTLNLDRSRLRRGRAAPYKPCSRPRQRYGTLPSD